jgi:type II secretory ATPase GspE/PulE/Tfp pilus assembly ATPase PilB-like protein
MQDNRLKHRLKADLAVSGDDLKIIHALLQEKLICYEEALIFSERVQDDYIYPVLSELSGIEFLRKETVTFPTTLRNTLPEREMRNHHIIPMAMLSDKVLEVATTNPLDLYTFRRIYEQTGLKIKPRYAEKFRIISLLNSTFGDSADLREVLDSFDSHQEEDTEASPVAADVMDQISSAMADEKDAPTVKYVQTLFRQAIRMKASDIHVEPREKRFLIRFRIDGVLQEIPSPPKHLQDNIITILKVMADLDISEKRAPQDGRIRLAYEGRDIDFRVSSIPSIYGEKIVIRVLDTSSVVLEFSSLGFAKDDEELIRMVIEKPHGIILAAGPTGSGKTTTLYTMLKEIATDDTNVTTLEDPVEYRLDGMTQCQIEVKAGMTFATGLRSILRQDPDIIMVGEIRDLETAELAIQASLTGHLVLSTIHTNSAIGTITRLANMGCDTYLVAATLACVLAQRLVRRLCPTCKEAYITSPEDLSSMGVKATKPVKLFKAVGCDKCAFTGYKGRVGIHELLIPNGELRELIGKEAMEFELFRYARKRCGLKILKESGIRKVLQGVTDYVQVLQATL